MNDLQRDFLEIITQLRTHLEYQKALGLRHVGMPVRRPAPAGAPPATQPGPARTSKPVAAAPRPVAQPTGLSAVLKEISGCSRCALSSFRTTIVFGEGNPDADLVFVGEAPGSEEERQGRPFAGAAGQLLTDIIVKGMNLKPDAVYLCTIVKCKPPVDRGPRQEELDTCELFFRKQIQAIKPRVIVALGDLAAQTLLKSKENIAALRGAWHTYQSIPVMPTFPPEHLVKHPEDKKFTWEDIKQVMAKLGIKVTKG